jgi:hypothetical protein
MGWTGSFKTTFAVNYFYKNLMRGLNGVFITFEITKDIIYSHLISRHSVSDKFKGSPVPKSKIQRDRLSKEEESLLIGDIEPDFRSKAASFTVLDRQDFGGFSKEDIRNRLLTLPFLPDFIIFDYVQLGKYESLRGVSSQMNKNLVNYYVRAFAELSQDLDRKGHRISTLLLSQVKREAFDRVTESGEGYTQADSSDSSEIEKSAFYLLSVYVDSFLKDTNEAKIQLLKNRGGKDIPEPFLVSVNPEFSTIGASASGSLTSNMGDLLDPLIDDLSFDDWE